MNGVPPLGRVRVVLSRPSHPGNIGAAARAMKTMGISRLVLVRPEAFPSPVAEARASGAADVLAGARVCGSLAEALQGTVLAVALTARRRELSAPPLWARDAAAELAAASRAGEVALVFGNETAGLSNDEVALCQRPAMIPVSAEYGSLNLGAAVQIMCYELRLAVADPGPPPAVADAGAPADHGEVEQLIAHFERALTASGFHDPRQPKRLLPRLRRLFARARLEKDEVSILRGMLTSFEKK